MNLYGEILPETELRFDYSSTYAVARNSRRGQGILAHTIPISLTKQVSAAALSIL